MAYIDVGGLGGTRVGDCGHTVTARNLQRCSDWRSVEHTSHSNMWDTAVTCLARVCTVGLAVMVARM